MDQSKETNEESGWDSGRARLHTATSRYLKSRKALFAGVGTLLIAALFFGGARSKSSAPISAATARHPAQVIYSLATLGAPRTVKRHRGFWEPIELEASCEMSRKSNRDRRSTNHPVVDAPKQEALLTLPPKQYCPHVPTPKQLAFLLCPRAEVFFGGAAGPGKTDGLLMAALQLVEQPNYHALLLRRTFRQLNQSNSIMNRARQWLANTDAVFRESDKRFTFPSGATITFGNLDSDDDVYQYDSSEFQFIGFDELTSFTEAQYTYLFSRLRTTRDNPVPLRMRSASNPGNRGHDWVKARFMIGQPQEVLQRDYPSRFFLPARISDNPHIRRDEYLAALANLEPVRRRQLLEGDWEVSPRGNLFRREWFAIEEDWPREATGVVRAWGTF